MHLLYNGHIVLEEELQLPVTNRAFQYNDGFFETIMLQDDKVRFWTDHVARMQEAAAALKLELPPQLTDANILEELLTVARCNNAENYGRIKLKVWRAGAGLYTPETNSAEWYSTILPATPLSAEALRIGISHSVTTLFSPFSHFKGPNALLYVLASVEKQERAFDDMLLLNREGMLAELISSNIFWIKEQTLYTPALDTGCVNGILRRNVLRWCQAGSIKVNEGRYTIDELLKADAVFAANVTGIKSIASVEGNMLPQEHPMLARLQKSMFT